MTQGSVQQPRAQERMNALTQQEVQTSNTVVEGTIRLSERIARVLFDSGASHSFISSSFATQISKESEPLGFQLVVSTPVGTKLTLMYSIKDVKLP